MSEVPFAAETEDCDLDLDLEQVFPIPTPAELWMRVATSKEALSLLRFDNNNGAPRIDLITDLADSLVAAYKERFLKEE